MAKTFQAIFTLVAIIIVGFWEKFPKPFNFIYEKEVARNIIWYVTLHPVRIKTETK